jgi:hypothetical protein
MANAVAEAQARGAGADESFGSWEAGLVSGPIHTQQGAERQAAKAPPAGQEHVYSAPIKSAALALSALMALGVIAGYTAMFDQAELVRLGQLQRVEQEIAEHNHARSLLIQHLAKNRGGKIAHLRGYAEQIDQLAPAPATVIFTPAQPGAQPEVAALPDLRQRIEEDIEQIESWTPPPLLEGHPDMGFSTAELGESRLLPTAMLAAALASLVLWSTMALRNLPALRAASKLRPGRAPLCWLLPPVNLYLPFVIMRDIWQGSDPATLTSPDRLRLPVISMWWLAMLATAAALGYAAHQLVTAVGVSMMTEATRLAFYGDVALCALAAASFAVVAAATWNQSRRVSLVENMEAQLGPRTAWRRTD